MSLQEEAPICVAVLVDEEHGLDGLVLTGLDGVDGLVLVGLEGVDGLVREGLGMPLEIEERVAAALYGDDGRTKVGTGDRLLLGLVLDGGISSVGDVIVLAELTRGGAFLLIIILEETSRAAALFGDDGRIKLGTGGVLLLGFVLDGGSSDISEVPVLGELTVRAAFSLTVEESRCVISFVELFRSLLTASVEEIPREDENPRTEIEGEEVFLIFSVKSTLFVDKALKDPFPPTLPGHLS